MSTTIIRALLLTVLMIPFASVATEEHSTSTAKVRKTQLSQISVATQGEGSPVILVPGLSTPRDVWSEITPGLSDSNELHLVQVNGFSKDDGQGNTQEGLLVAIADELHQYIKDHSLKNPVLVGHSMGGLVGMLLAAKHPDDLGRLVIIDSLPFYGLVFSPNATVTSLEAVAEGILQRSGAAATSADRSKEFEAIAKRLAMNPKAISEVAQWMANSNTDVVARASYELLKTDVRPLLPKIETPMTVLVATSPALPKTAAEQAYRAGYHGANDVEFVFIENSGHFTMLDQPIATRTAIEKAMDSDAR